MSDLIVVAGGGGFISSYLTADFLKKGYRVPVAGVNLQSKWCQVLAEIEKYH